MDRGSSSSIYTASEENFTPFFFHLSKFHSPPLPPFPPVADYGIGRSVANLPVVLGNCLLYGHFVKFYMHGI